MKEYSELVEEGYDNTAELYAEKRGEFGNIELLERIAEMLPKGASILDVGCGTGNVANFFLEKGFSVTGVDNSEKMLGICRKNAKSGEFVKGDMLKIDFGEKRFDCILFFFSLIHIRKKNVPKVLKKFSKFLKDGGVLAVSVIEGEGEYVFPIKFSPENRMFGSAFAKEEIGGISKVAGFDIVLFQRKEVDDKLYGKEVQLFIVGRKR